jgi:hypothetical protein
MTTREVQKTPQEKQQLYLEQINQFFGQVKKWLPTPFETVQIENCLLEDKTGEYQTPILSIVKKDKQDDAVADLLPEGISFLTDDALIEIHGAYDHEEMIYMQENNQRYTIKNGEKCPMYQGFVQEGWYWITDLNQIRLITKDLFIDLLNRVSGPLEVSV